ncbi:DUF3443 family protein, partial [Ramlibacter sp.]
RSHPAPRTWLQALFLSLLLGLLAGCGGGGGGGSPAPSPAPSAGSTSSGTTTSGGTSVSPGPNVVAVMLDGGTDGSAFNSPFVTVTVCTPGTQTCQVIDHVLVDTGSSGLRVLASALGATALPAEPAPVSGALAECAQFASGFSWGAVRRADVKIGGESAANLPVQVVNDTGTAYAQVPSGCSSTGTNFGVGSGAKGLLGVGLEPQDCTLCATRPSLGVYYACDASGNCSSTLAPLSSQLRQPAAGFATDNNGVALVLPTVPATGATSLAGNLVFGIGTRDNNALGSAAIYGADAQGNFSTTYKGTKYTNSFLDSGSNGLFFPDASIPQCSGSSGFYCPPQPLSLTATINGAASPTGVGGTSSPVAFTVDSLTSLDASATVGSVGGSTAGLGNAFDWGLPFFFGRTVFVALRGASTPAGPGPYWAF